MLIGPSESKAVESACAVQQERVIKHALSQVELLKKRTFDLSQLAKDLAGSPKTPEQPAQAAQVAPATPQKASKPPTAAVLLARELLSRGKTTHQVATALSDSYGVTDPESVLQAAAAATNQAA